MALQDASNGCTAKTLQVHPYATTEDVCQICADKFKVSDPENYALFLLTDETTQQLAPDTHPQRIKAELHSRPQPQLFFFVYRQIQDLTVPSDQLNENTLSNWESKPEFIQVLSKLLPSPIYSSPSLGTKLPFLKKAGGKQKMCLGGNREGRMCLTDAAFFMLCLHYFQNVLGSCTRPSRENSCIQTANVTVCLFISSWMPKHTHCVSFTHSTFECSPGLCQDCTYYSSPVSYFSLCSPCRMRELFSALRWRLSGSSFLQHLFSNMDISVPKATVDTCFLM